MSSKKSFTMSGDSVATSFLTKVGTSEQSAPVSQPAKPAVTSGNVASAVPNASPQDGYYIDSFGHLVEKRSKIQSLALPPSVYAKLKVAAAEKGMKTNALINLILSDYVERL